MKFAGKCLILFIAFIFLISFVSALNYAPTSWYTANSSFVVLESEKNCGVGSDNTNDGWGSPQKICGLDNSFTDCSDGCSGNYLIVKPNVPSQKQLSQITSVKLNVYFTPRGPAHSGEHANIGLAYGGGNIWGLF